MKEEKNKKACPERSRKVFVALSGGVDSSVAAALLKKQGYDVVGVHMRCWRGDCDGQARDVEDARRVAGILGIPFYVFDFEKEYKERVFDYMIREYTEGRTPNPDVMCNKEIKFGLFLEKALALGADYVATGHYVRIKRAASSWQLAASRDRLKDQSYFLWTLTQNQLRHCLFPIGDYTKQEVRALAKKFGLPTAMKKDSQGLCFVGKVNFADFLREYIPEKNGEVVTSDGEQIGEHCGAHYYTIGQRHGFGGGARPQRERSFGGQGVEPLYVVQKDVATNTIMVATKCDPALYKKEVIIRDTNWINEVPQEGKEYLARIRYRQPLQKCRLLASGNSQLAASSQLLVAVFQTPQRAVASGQALVLYDGAPSNSSGQAVLGGGFIV